jgi:hypothetical protein
MALRTWSLPTLPKATLEDVNDETLGWSAQTTAGPTHLHSYSPFKTNYAWKGAGLVPTTAPVAATLGTSTSGGTLPTATVFSYSYAYTTDKGETLPAVIATVTTGAGATNSNTVTVPAIPAYATGVNIYGRLASNPGGNLVLLQNQATAALWTDTGAPAVTVVNGVVTSGQRKHSGNNEALALVNH